jgi:hypothetical protein
MWTGGHRFYSRTLPLAFGPDVDSPCRFVQDEDFRIYFQPAGQ